MKFIVSLSALLLFGNFVRGYSAESANLNQSKIEPNDATFTPNHRDCHHKTPNPNSRSTTKLTDLNFDVLFEIMADLNVTDLFNLARSSAKLSDPVSESFRRKYKNYRVEIAQENPGRANIDPLIPTQGVDVENNLRINDLPTAIGILTHFGHLIRHLVVQNHVFNRNESAAIIRCLEKYCADSLTQLNIDFIKGDTFTHFTKPFSNVEELSLIVEARRIKIGVLPLNQLFPRLRQLTMKLYSDIDYSFVYLNFLQLKSLSLGASYEIWGPKDHVEELLRKNPQISSFDGRNFPKDYAKVISRHLKTLENLTLYEFDIGNDSVRFENVKRFNLYDVASSSIVNLSLPSLESMEFFYSSNLLAEWTAFFRNHRNLRRLHLMEPDDDMSVPLVELTAELQDLIEVTFECRTRIRAQTIIKFIENHEKLTRFELLSTNLRRNTLTILEKRFENEWHIFNSTSKFMMTSVVFERKLLP